MSKEIEIGNLKSRLLSTLMCCLVGGILLIGGAQTAQAYPVTVTGDTADLPELILTEAQNILTRMENASGAVANSYGQLFTVQATNQDTDTIDANNANLVDKTTAENLAITYTPPSFHSYCHESQSAASGDNESVASASMAQTMAQGNQAIPREQNTAYNNLLKAEMLGFAPCTNQNDPEYAAWKSLGCNSVDGGTHERQDRNLESLLNPLEYPVDPALPKPNATSVFAPPTVVSGEKYYPFIAALLLCQHITPSQPVPPQQTANAATIDAFTIGTRLGTEAMISSSASACYRALARRMQFGSDTANFVAVIPDATKGIATRHDEQVARCTEDHAAGYLDDGLYADCQTNGRSDLQAEHDEAFRLEMANFQIQHLAVLPFATTELMTDSARHDQVHFYESLGNERTSLIDAIQASSHQATDYTAAFSQAVRPQ